MGRGGSAIIRSVTLVGNGTDGSASGGKAIVVLNTAENRQRDQFAAGRRLLEELGIGGGYGMHSEAPLPPLRRACPVVVFDELPDDPPNVGGVEEDEVVECLMPNLRSNSPKILSSPQLGLSALMRRMKSMCARGIVGRPIFLVLDFRRQQSLKP